MKNNVQGGGAHDLPSCHTHLVFTCLYWLSLPHDLLINSPVSEKSIDIVETMCKFMLISNAHTDLTEEAAYVFGINMILHTVFRMLVDFWNWTVGQWRHTNTECVMCLIIRAICLDIGVISPTSRERAGRAPPCLINLTHVWDEFYKFMR